MDSMISKTGKLRALLKDLKTKYADDDGAKKPTPQFIGHQVTFYTMSKQCPRKSRRSELPIA